MYSQKNLNPPTPPPLQETSAAVLVRILVGTHSYRKKTWLPAWPRAIENELSVAEDTSLE